MPSQKALVSHPRRSRCLVTGRSITSPGTNRIQEIQNFDNFPIHLGISIAQPGPVLVNTEETLTREELTNTVTVLVADDHPVVREGLVSVISRQPDMRVVAEASNGREAVEKFLTERPKVALLDLRMSDMDGIEALVSICEQDPGAHVAIITSYQLEEDIYRALRAGALGYILKDATLDQLTKCIHAVAEGQTWVPPQIGAKLARRVSDQELTRRETQVLHAVAAGKSNKEIGAVFSISEATVKVHMTHILEKLRVTGRAEAINVAVKRGLVRLDVAAAA
jgi:two-component system NarL family response regulator